MSLDVYLEKMKMCDVYEANITHNLNKMAKEAGIYQHLWRPEDLGIKEAWELIEPLEKALKDMEDRPGHDAKVNPENGWGSYDGLLMFIAKYINACEENPESLIRIWR